PRDVDERVARVGVDQAQRHRVALPPGGREQQRERPLHQQEGAEPEQERARPHAGSVRRLAASASATTVPDPTTKTAHRPPCSSRSRWTSETIPALTKSTSALTSSGRTAVRRRSYRASPKPSA